MGGIIKRLSVLPKSGALPALSSQTELIRYGEQLMRGLAAPSSSWVQQQGAALSRSARFDAAAQQALAGAVARQFPSLSALEREKLQLAVVYQALKGSAGGALTSVLAQPAIRSEFQKDVLGA